MNIYVNKTKSKLYLDLKPTARQVRQAYHLKKLTEIKAYLLDEIDVCIAKQIAKNQAIQYNHRHCRQVE